MFKDYYAILGITFPSSFEEVKIAYRKQSLKWHPDRNPGLNTEEQMKDVNEAYSVLKDEDLKKRYDDEYKLFNHQRSASHDSENSSQYEPHGQSEQRGQRTYRRQYEYDYDIKDEKLKDDIRSARKAAEDYVREFMASLKRDTKTAAAGAIDGAMPYIVAGIVLSILFLLIQTCS